MSNFKKRYRDLETEVLSSLRFHVNFSAHFSEHTGKPYIPIEVNNPFLIKCLNIKELTILDDDSLVFLDDKGGRYGLSNVSLKTLIDIIDNGGGKFNINNFSLTLE